jgi:hypothetical protein
MRQELLDSEKQALQHFWDNDISVGGAPDGWTLESFSRKVENKIFDGWSFKRATMMVLATVPRPDEKPPVEPINREDLQSKVELMKAARRARMVFAKNQPKHLKPISDEERAGIIRLEVEESKVDEEYRKSLGLKA